jgi:endonuclease/exonuclease/phosphatase family metal-dependent hydrolase
VSPGEKEPCRGSGSRESADHEPSGQDHVLWTPPAPWLALILEGVAFSLPAARGAWLSFACLSALAALLAMGTGRTRLVQVRAALAFLAAVTVLHPLLSLLQFLVALAWCPLPRGRREVAGAAILCGLLAPLAEPFLADVLRPQPGTFSLMSWNVAFLRKSGWEYQVLPNFRFLAVDMVVLQEVGWDEQRPGRSHWDEVRARDRDSTLRLAEALELPYCWSDLPMGYRNVPYQSGCVVLSRYPFEVLQDTLPQGPKDPPPAFLVETPQGALVVSPLHLWSPPFANRAGRREALANLLQRLPSAYPRVVAGDTNLLPMDRFDVPVLHGYQDAALGSPFYGGTWPSHFPLARLDGIFLSEQLEVIRFRTLATEISDHRPIVAQFRWRPPQSEEFSGGAGGNS